ncbi:hypothetical protein SAMN02745150_00646 [Brevinema andersonii]|uniref:Electron transport complex protein RnfE n=2 Tax=Brevinema andersonii TaxID=34097 RepID=A0A1I1DMT6_BREAD|nr:hypothetical protein SAMN02745150_00646 [Brevinema andersonii]
MKFIRGKMNKIFIDSSTLFVVVMFPLIYTIDYTKIALIAAIGVLLLYPLIGTINVLFFKYVSCSIRFYIASFLATLLSGLYLLLIKHFDFQIYSQLKFIFPASMASCSVMIFWLNENIALSEKSFGKDAILLSFLLIIAAMVREISIDRSINMQLGDWEIVWYFSDFVINGIFVYRRAITLFFIGFMLMIIAVWEKSQ